MARWLSAPSFADLLTGGWVAARLTERPWVENGSPSSVPASPSATLLFEALRLFLPGCAARINRGYRGYKSTRSPADTIDRQARIDRTRKRSASP
eukprot:1157257-Pelagomonas_calceolata.AAC.1